MNQGIESLQFVSLTALSIKLISIIILKKETQNGNSRILLGRF